MNIVRAFFVREIVRLHHNIDVLERGLNGCNPTDSRSAGQRAMLENEYCCRKALLDLAEDVTDVTGLEQTLRIKYGAAKYRHDHLRDRQPNGKAPCQCDDWWETLGAMQYYCHLTQSLNRLVREISPQEFRAELHKVARSRDVSLAAARSELLHAIASAEGSAVDKQHLVRHDVHPTNGRKPDD